MSKLKYYKFEVVSPAAAITKLGAGRELYIPTTDSNSGLFLSNVSNMPLRDVMMLEEQGYKFLQIKED